MFQVITMKIDLLALAAVMSVLFGAVGAIAYLCINYL